MKRMLLVIVAAVALGAMAIPAFAGTGAGTGIISSVHDITAYSKLAGNVGLVIGDNEGRVCVFCHTPHHADTDASLDYNPLWSHTVTTQTYTPYVTATFDATAFGGTDPLVGPSRLCMSCHDGSISVDQHGGEGAQAGGFKLTGNHVVGSTTHAIDHPIGFSYSQAKTAKGTSINAATATWLGGTGTVTAALHQGDIMTCATCHDVHNKTNAVNAASLDGLTRNWLVRSPQAGSQLCLTCHNT